MNFDFEKRWRDTVSTISKNFGEEIDLQSILFLNWPTRAKLKS